MVSRYPYGNRVGKTTMHAYQSLARETVAIGNAPFVAEVARTSNKNSCGVVCFGLGGLGGDRWSGLDQSPWTTDSIEGSTACSIASLEKNISLEIRI